MSEFSAEDFGNIHFGYIVAACGRGFWLARKISRSDAKDLDTARGRRNETYDEAMVKWGHKLYARWGSRYGPRNYFSVK